MIYLLEGAIKIKTDKFVVIDVSGVGYRVFCSSSVLEKSEDIGKNIKLYTHQYIRENIMDLYGFLSREDLEFFELLISINGIGPKAALSILALAPVDKLKQAIASGQKTLLTKVSGIGQKTAERIILELKSKITASVSDIKNLSADSDAIDALESLGYARYQAQKALESVSDEISSIEDRVKQALKFLGKK
ncbi:Holliday junction branch migration protein RuvA [Patescibacteria group bacterium]